MVGKLTAALLLSFCSISCYLSAIVEPVSFPIDGRRWVLLDPVLPYGQNEIWLVPEGSQGKGKEFIVVSELSLKATVDKAVDPSVVLKGDSVYKNNATDSKTILAYLNNANQYYTANCAFKGDLKLHDILYIAPHNAVSEQERQTWADRLDQASVANIQDDPSRITVTSRGVFQNHKKLSGHPHLKQFTHPELGFSVSFPSTWAFDTATNTFKKMKGATGVQYLAFHRMDELAKGSVGVIHSDGPITQQRYEQLIETAKNTFFQEDGLVARGNIENHQGIKGKYLVLKMPNDHFEIVAFFPPQEKKLFIMKMSVHEQNFQPMFDTILETFKSFTLPSSSNNSG